MITRIASFVLVAWLLGFAAFALTLPAPADDGITDGIVVLTGGPGRIRRGIMLLEDKRARRLLVSGVDRQVRAHELAAEFDVPQDLAVCCIDLGRESVDTRSNADETAAWVKKRRYRSIRLVTTDWHMPRARFELSRMLDGDVVIVGDAVRSEPSFRVLFTEYNKYVLRRLAAPLGI